MKSKEYYICAGVLLTGLFFGVVVPQRAAEDKRRDREMVILSNELNTVSARADRYATLYVRLKCKTSRMVRR